MMKRMLCSCGSVMCQIFFQILVLLILVVLQSLGGMFRSVVRQMMIDFLVLVQVVLSMSEGIVCMVFWIYGCGGMFMNLSMVLNILDGLVLQKNFYSSMVMIGGIMIGRQVSVEQMFLLWCILFMSMVISSGNGNLKSRVSMVNYSVLIMV